MESDSSRRFSSLFEEEKTAFLEKAIRNSATKFWTGVLSEFASMKGMAIDFPTVEEDALANLLEDFYCSPKKRKTERSTSGRATWLHEELFSVNRLSH